MLRKISTLALLAGTFTASAALAEEHVILIMPEAYFPAITYVDPGDTVRFVNASGSDHNIIAKNNAWAIGPIAMDGETIIAVAGGMQNQFYNADSASDSDGDGTQEYQISGTLSFSNPPLN